MPKRSYPQSTTTTLNVGVADAIADDNSVEYNINALNEGEILRISGGEVDGFLLSELTNKSTLVDNDLFLIADSENSYTFKKTAKSSLVPNSFKDASGDTFTINDLTNGELVRIFDGALDGFLLSDLTAKTSLHNNDLILIADSESSYAYKKVTRDNLKFNSIKDGSGTEFTFNTLASGELLRVLGGIIDGFTLDQLTEKAELNDNDLFLIADSEAGYQLKKCTRDNSTFASLEDALGTEWSIGTLSSGDLLKVETSSINGFTLDELIEKSSVHPSDIVLLADYEHLNQMRKVQRRNLIPKWNYFEHDNTNYLPTGADSSNIVEYWNLDATASALTGRKNSTVLTAVGSPSYRAIGGNIQSILFVRGSSQYLLSTAATNMKLTGALTIEFIGILHGVASTMGITSYLRNYSVPTYDYSFGWTTRSGSMVRDMNYYAGNNFINASSLNFAPGSADGQNPIYHYAMTRNASPSTSIKYYINGIQLGTTITAGAAPTSADAGNQEKFTIGCTADHSTYGEMNTMSVIGIRFWNTELSAAQLLESYQIQYR